ncbi:cation:proton antiporter [Streptomyces hygroscopicus]|uniref:Kef-type K+ transport system membrane component KefB n=1 Tax=Streptomyces demainii TaxID=588122 RepID=A0ABT9L6Q7_9ACTN|nr:MULTISPECIES: cation:proton antiporter [Streptomyces]MDN3060080.1 cation:proton antiporter [Streptomyces sp. SRF1]MDP9616395.1 Kef-type K+ transport system membrane component KefB [Streptomyces demainii]
MAYALQALAALAVVLALARPARRAATLVRQPPVIGEIALGLVVVPLLTTAAGPDLVGTLLPSRVTDHLHTVGLAGLALYLTGVGHSARPRRGELSPRSYGRLLAGSLLPGLLAGVLLSVWVVWRDAPGERGAAPTAALVLLLAAAFAVTAVPVLARILTDRGIEDTTEGRLSLLVAVSIDALTWLVLTAALAAAAEGGGRLVRALAVIVGGVGAAVLLRRLLGRAAVGRLCARRPAAAASVLGAVAVAAAVATERAGLTAIFGAVLVGLAVPRDGEQTSKDEELGPRDGEPGARTGVVRAVERCGRLFVPVFFVTAGLQVSTDGPDGFSWATFALVLLLATAAKLGGGYAGARLARLPAGTALRFGVLMNTRGLTEIAVLQAGLSAGILSPGLFLALVLMALVTTAATGPLLSLTDRRRAAVGAPARPTTGVPAQRATGAPPRTASEELSP